MRGIVFTEFLEMAEERFGYRMVDKIILESELLSKGVYTAVGEYEEEELFILIEKLCKETNMTKKQLFILLGEKFYTSFIAKFNSTLLKLELSNSFFERLENYINIEIRRLFSKTSFPKIEIIFFNKEKLIMNYCIGKRMAELIEGFILGCLNVSMEKVKVEKIDSTHSGVSESKFILERY